MTNHEIETALAPYVARYVNATCTQYINGQYIPLNNLATWQELYRVTLEYVKPHAKHVLQKTGNLDTVKQVMLRSDQILKAIGETPIVYTSATRQP